MRVVVPYTEAGLNPGCVPAIQAAGYEPETYLMEREDSYYELLAWLWRTREAFTIIEHDVLVRPETLRELEECPHPWCAFGYEYASFGLYYGLGCARFGAETLRSAPFVMREVGRKSDAYHPQRHWCALDAWLQHELRKVNQEQHRHGPPLEHRHGAPAHGCRPELDGVLVRSPI